MAVLKIAHLVLFLPFLSACSLYESDGRKFLESKLAAINVHVEANVQSCDSETPTRTWVLLEKNPEADIFALEGETYDMRVRPLVNDSFNCYFRFSSAQEMFEKSAAAVELTIERLASAPKPR